MKFKLRGLLDRACPYRALCFLPIGSSTASVHKHPACSHLTNLPYSSWSQSGMPFLCLPRMGGPSGPKPWLCQATPTQGPSPPWAPAGLRAQPGLGPASPVTFQTKQNCKFLEGMCVLFLSVLCTHLAMYCQDIEEAWVNVTVPVLELIPSEGGSRKGNSTVPCRWACKRAHGFRTVLSK